MRAFLFVLFGYISGSILFANVFSKILGKKDILVHSKDKNPGTANAFMYGGIWCGIFTLCCDLLKGMLPVHLYLKGIETENIHILALSLVMAAPVVGHIYPLFHGFEGGKGIAATFGCMLGLMPNWMPVLLLAGFFIFYSLFLQVKPHFYRTIITYISTLVALLCIQPEMVAVNIGFLFIVIAVCIRMHHSNEEREKMQVRLLWKF